MGILVSLFIFCLKIKKKYPVLTWIALVDLLSIPALLAGSLIRVGNFFNQEIIGKTGEQAPGCVVAEDAIADSNVVAALHAQGGSVGVERAKPVHHQISAVLDVDRVAIVAAIRRRDDNGIGAGRPNRNRLVRRADFIKHIEAQVTAVGDEGCVARGDGCDGLSDFAKRLRLGAGIVVVARR